MAFDRSPSMAMTCAPPPGPAQRALKRIMLRTESRLRFIEHIEGRGMNMYRVACERDLEGIVGKRATGRDEAV